jgi:biopolymer transport protein ExbB
MLYKFRGKYMDNMIAGFSFILRGGFMMYPLLFAAFLGLTVILERFFILHKRLHTPTSFINHILGQIRSGKLEQAEKECENRKTPASAVLAIGIEHFANSVEEMELAMKNEAESWVPQLEKRIEVLDTVVTAAPLMGLLGTITGMMSSFRVLSEKGVNEPNAITGGVAEALIATASGIFIALICLVAYNYLTTKVKFLIYDVESAASKLMEVRMAVTRKKANL